MTVFDLLFLACCVGSVGTLARVAYQLVRGRSGVALRLIVRWTILATCYVGLVILVSLAQPQRTVPVGSEQCWDDWCITVDSIARSDSIGHERAMGTWVVVTARVSSHMRVRRQSEPDAYAYLLDAAGNRVEQSERGQAALQRAGLAGPLLGAFVEPDGAFVSRLAFDVPRTAQGLGFVKERRARFPGIVIIGDNTSLLHKRTIVPL